MVEILVENPLVAVMLVIAAGAAVGQIPFGPLRFGAAGALFVGLGVLFWATNGLSTVGGVLGAAEQQDLESRILASDMPLSTDCREGSP